MGGLYRLFPVGAGAADYAAENPKVVDLQIGNLMTFNKKSSIGQVSVDGSNTALSYDVTNNALKVSVKEADARQSRQA